MSEVLATIPAGHGAGSRRHRARRKPGLVTMSRARGRGTRRRRDRRHRHHDAHGGGDHRSGFDADGGLGRTGRQDRLHAVLERRRAARNPPHHRRLDEHGHRFRRTQRPRWSPHRAAITPDGRLVYVADRSRHLISVVKPGVADRPARHPIGWSGTADGVAIMPDGQTAYVADRSSKAVRVIPVDEPEMSAGPA